MDNLDFKVSEGFENLSMQAQVDELLAQFVALANSHADHCDIGVITSALVAASARFSAFYIASASESRKDLKEDKDDSILRFAAEFKRELALSLEDYIENYKVYMRDE